MKGGRAARGFLVAATAFAGGATQLMTSVSDATFG
jgi:hypothetical protein